MGQQLDAKRMREVRAERYALMSMARRLLSARGRAEGLVWGDDYHRVCKCRRSVHHGAEGVEVYQSLAHQAAHYVGLVTCGSVWACPVCAAKVQERRREEIARAIDWGYKEGRQWVMVTLTFPHQSWHKLDILLKQQADALAKMRQGKPWKKFLEKTGYDGVIRSLELTRGANGWHPHTHELWLVNSDVDAKELQADITAKWASACMRAGLLTEEKLDAFMLHAVDVKGWCSTSDYLAKQDDSKHWGADREIAKASTKKGRAKGVHPFGLLRAAFDGDSKSADLYCEYVDSMTGKRQIFWTNGLKKKIGLHEVSDEQIAEESREESALLGTISLDEWRAVLAADMRAELLEAAEQGGWQAARALIRRAEASAYKEAAELVAEGRIAGVRDSPTSRTI